MTLKIKNWARYQSYKDRRPPWIRFHRTILDDFEFQSMTANSRALLPMLWLLACEDKDPKSGEINIGIDAVSFRLRQNKKVIDACLRELQACDFIECIETVTESLRDSNETVTSETETETETKTKGTDGALTPTPKKGFDYSADFLEFWQHYPRKVGKQAANKAWILAKRKGLTLDVALSAIEIQRTWDKWQEGFIVNPSTWLNQARWEDEPPPVTTPTHRSASQLDQDRKMAALGKWAKGE